MFPQQTQRVGILVIALMLDAAAVFAQAPATSAAPATPAVTGSAGAPSAGANEPNLNAMFQAAMASFQADKWQDAVTQLEGFIKGDSARSDRAGAAAVRAGLLHACGGLF